MKMRMNKTVDLEKESIDDLFLEINDISKDIHQYLYKKTNEDMVSDTQHIYGDLEKIRKINLAIDRKPIREKIDYYKSQLKLQREACKVENYEFAAILNDIAQNFDAVNEFTKTTKKTTRTIKVDKTDKTNNG